MNRQPDIEWVARLGDDIAKSWRAVNFDESRFAHIARTHLSALPVGELSPDEIVDWALQAEAIPMQHDVRAEFGQPPVTLYFKNGAPFYIQALFWAEGTPAIHQHSFSGAFCLIGGSSIHTTYSFEENSRINSRLLFGTLRFNTAELLRPGTVREIISGAGFIHATFHMERPSVSLVVRTVSDGTSGPQYRYRRCGVAEDPFFAPELQTRKLQLVRLSRAMQSAHYSERLLHAVAGSDFYTGYRLLEDAFIADPDGVAFDRALAAFHERHGEPPIRLRDIFLEEKRSQFLISRRALLVAPHHRFLLGLLLSVPRRHEVYSLARSYSDSEAALSTWVREIGTMKDAAGEPLLGVDLDETSLRVIEFLMNGDTPEGVIGRLRETYDVEPEDEGLIRRLCGSLKSSPILGALVS